MAISKEDKLIVFVFLLIVGIILFGLDSCSKRNEIKEKEELYNSFIKEKAKQLSNQKKSVETKVIVDTKKADSALRVVSALELQLKQTRSYYQTKLNSLEKINSYSSRQRLSDSLYRSM